MIRRTVSRQIITGKTTVLEMAAGEAFDRQKVIGKMTVDEASGR